jgi:hypothetical protein
MTERPHTPSSSAQALVVSGERSMRGVKTSLDELDDEDFAVVGRAYASASPRQVLSGLGVVVGVTAGVALVPVSLVGAGLVLLALPAFAIVVGRRDLRATLEDHGLSPAVVEQISASATLLRTSRANLSSKLVRRLVPRNEDYARFGKVLVDAARERRDRSE